ncbi:hypothetical protein EC957_000506 [Mortierella hygrophila]|uniref:F-box domain-containing protein n=1 Tax=Mortierella hygrophila TaxID=979708 RepID=A0A9P6F5Y9_9FUNG|nr:hypothetical protein EC957_000506 [Mortierella hygrophila]
MPARPSSPPPFTDNLASIAGSTSTTCPSLLPTSPLRIPEILTNILSTLTKPQLATCSTVSRAWKQAAIPLLWSYVDYTPHSPDFMTLLAIYGHHVVYLDLYLVNTPPFVPPPHITLSKILSVTPFVRHLYLKSSPPGQGAAPTVLVDAASKVSSILAVISDTVAHQLVTLRLDIGDLAEQDARTFFPTLRALRELELTGYRQYVVDAVVDSGLRYLIKVVFLDGAGTTLGVHTTEDGVFGDVSIEELGRSFPGLQTLGIFSNDRITLAGLTGFADHCKTLTRFQLQCCPYVGSDEISALTKASPGLAHVSLGHSSASDSILMDLASSLDRASRLRSLSVSFSPLITTAGIRTIVDSCFGLEELDFELCPRVTLDVFSEPAWVCLGLKVLNMSNIHGGSTSSIDSRRARSGLDPTLMFSFSLTACCLKDMYRQLGRLLLLQELDMCGLPFRLNLMDQGRDAVEGLERLRILRLSEQTFPLEPKDVIWLATRLSSLRWLELGEESIRNHSRKMLMEVNPDIRIFIVDKRSHSRRALQRRHRLTEPPTPDAPTSTFADDWVYDEDEEVDELDNNDLGGDMSDDDEPQGMDGLEYEHLDHIEFSPPHPLDADTDSYGDDNNEDCDEDPDAFGAGLLYRYGSNAYPVDNSASFGGSHDYSEDESDHEEGYIAFEKSPGCSSYPPSDPELDTGDEESMKSDDEESMMSSDEESMMSSDEESMMSSDEESMMSSDEESMMSSDEESMMSSDEESIMSSDEESMMSSDEEPMKSDDEVSMGSGDTRPMGSDDEVPYETDDGDSLGLDEEESEELDREESYEPQDENSLDSEDEEEPEDGGEDEIAPNLSQMSRSGHDDEEQDDIADDAYHPAQAEAAFLAQQTEEDFYEEQAREAYEIDQSRPEAEAEYENELEQAYLEADAEYENELEQAYLEADAEYENELEQAYLEADAEYENGLEQAYLEADAEYENELEQAYLEADAKSLIAKAESDSEDQLEALAAQAGQEDEEEQESLEAPTEFIAHQALPRLYMEQDSSQEYDEQDSNDDEDIGQDDGHSDLDTVDSLLDQDDDSDQKDDDEGLEQVKYGYDCEQESDALFALDPDIYYMDSEQNNMATEGDITSSERFDSYGDPDSDYDDDDRRTDPDQDDSDYAQYDSDNVDSADQDDDESDEFSDGNGTDEVVWDNNSDDDDGVAQGIYQDDESDEDL